MSTREDLVAKLQDKQYREGFVSSQIEMTLPYQIRAMRGDMSQAELAEKAGMKQSRISAIERPGYGSLTLNTLQRLAAAFDVALLIRFAPFSDLVQWAEHFSPDTFHVPSFDADDALFSGTVLAAVAPKGPGSSATTVLTDYVSISVRPSTDEYMALLVPQPKFPIAASSINRFINNPHEQKAEIRT